MVGSEGNYAKWNKPVRERQILYDFTHMCNLMCKIKSQIRNRSMDTWNRLTAVWGEREESQRWNKVKGLTKEHTCTTYRPRQQCGDGQREVGQGLGGGGQKGKRGDICNSVNNKIKLEKVTCIYFSMNCLFICLPIFLLSCESFAHILLKTL